MEIDFREFTKKCAEDVLHWARGVKEPTHLGSYRNLLQSSYCGATEREKKLEHLVIEVPPNTSPGDNINTIDFYFSDMIETACELLCNPTLVQDADDILWTQSATYGDMDHLFTPDLNTGEWYKETEDLLFGYPNVTGKTLLPICCFIDDTNLVARGTQTAKPIQLTLGCFPERIRNKEVRRRLAIV